VGHQANDSRGGGVAKGSGLAVAGAVFDGEDADDSPFSKDFVNDAKGWRRHETQRGCSGFITTENGPRAGRPKVAAGAGGNF
jgi:hypothetical protein